VRDPYGPAAFTSGSWSLIPTNPYSHSRYQGFQLLCVIVVTFPPSREFEPILRSFLKKYRGDAGGVGTMATWESFVIRLTNNMPLTVCVCVFQTVWKS
jgi:hypothetical protein